MLKKKRSNVNFDVQFWDYLWEWGVASGEAFGDG